MYTERLSSNALLEKDTSLRTSGYKYRKEKASVRGNKGGGDEEACSEPLSSNSLLEKDTSSSTSGYKYREERASVRGNAERDKQYKDPSDYITKNYHVGQMLGSGGFGTVYSGIRRRDNMPVAIKNVIKKKVTEWGQLNGYNVPMEICLLKKVSHIPGVIKMLEWFETRNGYICDGKARMCKRLV
ncbi:hypothetical protein DPMN_162497 [Dreissena polymorpha]|uniref:non-specific serine/threonine protein kinase n=1 Tax=Dreissena polymorpha TaxID=45954 RepID=A0A9D4EQN3_DREPO|nr:hypothetical protein DPMN_162497 [Dreissena polymorpha]